MYCVGVARPRREVKIRCSDVEALWDYLLSALAYEIGLVFLQNIAGFCVSLTNLQASQEGCI